MERNKKGTEHYLECSFVSILDLSFANGSIKVSLHQSLLESKFTFIHALTSQKSGKLCSWRAVAPLRKQQLSLK